MSVDSDSCLRQCCEARSVATKPKPRRRRRPGRGGALPEIAAICVNRRSRVEGKLSSSAARPLSRERRECLDRVGVAEGAAAAQLHLEPSANAFEIRARTTQDTRRRGHDIPGEEQPAGRSIQGIRGPLPMRCRSSCTSWRIARRDFVQDNEIDLNPLAAVILRRTESARAPPRRSRTP